MYQTMEESTKLAADAGSRSPLGTVPVLVYDHGLDPNNRQTALAIGDQSLHTSVVPELADNYYHVTPHGWVLLVAPGPSPRTRLWCPGTGKSVSLPAMERELPEDINWRCYLSETPTAASSSCIVLVMEIHRPNFVYCRVGDSRWESHSYDLGDVNLPPEYAPPRPLTIQHTAAVGDRFYFQETARKLGAVDFSQATPEFSFVAYPQPEIPDGCNCFRGQLVASRDELFDVYVYHKGFTAEVMTARVYRVDLSGAHPTLCEVKDLGDRAFLMSNHNAQLLLGSASKYGVKGNRVYFSYNVLGDLDGGLLHIYDLDDQSLEVVRPCPEMGELFRNPFWVMPTDQEVEL